MFSLFKKEKENKNDEDHLSLTSVDALLINSAKRIGSWGDEPIYKVGNPYKINGKWYYPAVDYQYDEVGIASWYGPGFHGKTTANGEVFDQNKILFAPGKASNPGGVAVSGLEMSQNSLRYNWTREEVDAKLHAIMVDIHTSCVAYGSDGNGYTNYVKGANIAGFVKVADAMLDQGVV